MMATRDRPRNAISCPSGFQMTDNRLGCNDKNECDYQPCGLGGSCYNLEDGLGWYCHCPQGFRCTNCSCDGENVGSQHDKSIGLSGNALAIMLLCLFAYLSKNIRCRISFRISFSSFIRMHECFFLFLLYIDLLDFLCILTVHHFQVNSRYYYLL